MIKPVIKIVDGTMEEYYTISATIPEGYAIVPIEPTEAMYVGGMDYLHKRGTAWAVNDLYKAMIAAYKEE